ncbi:hypothetical protein ACFSYG_11935 [Leeuwenhoekiella polynyae]|uniref:Uncharacterized protein n=1 Tax=Leeuwenhoekiella polynyae TaxID=1550906 RepID=A0A4Q0PFN2_9FLAO|nr:hypothetical protein [Leeuwenhoekiella polynyae]RXG25694.1 hypothetical protein DSM02_861 [Leeuwenhoekiella polynyae]
MYLNREAAFIQSDSNPSTSGEWIGGGGSGGSVNTGTVKPTTTPVTTVNPVPTTVKPIDTKTLQADRATIKYSILGLIGKLPGMNKGLYIKALYEIGLPHFYDFSPQFNVDVTAYVAKFYIQKLNDWVAGKLSQLSAPMNLGELKAQAHVASVNKIIVELHIARQYYCFMAGRTIGLEQAKYQGKKAIVTTYANWLATGLSNAVKTAGGSIELKPTQVTASNTTQGIEVYNWQNQTSIAKFQAFAVNVATAQKPYEVNVGPVKELPPVIVTTTEFTKGEGKPQPTYTNTGSSNGGSGSGAGSNSNSGSGSNNQVPDGSQSLVNNLTDDVKDIADGKKPNRWWWWLIGAAVGGYILNSNSTTVTTGETKPKPKKKDEKKPSDQ